MLASMIELICTKTCSTCRKAVALLDEKGIPYKYREYTKDPLSEEEIRNVLSLLGLRPKDVLRVKDAKERGLTGSEPDGELIAAMARHPTLLQRPIGIAGGKAVMGRPPENLLALAGE
jgi:arsenate reductase